MSRMIDPRRKAGPVGPAEALPLLRDRIRPGVRVKVTQQIAARNYTWTADVTGTVVEYEQKQTGSWFAHSKNDKLWLDRLLIRKNDGELVKTLDAYFACLGSPTEAAERLHVHRNTLLYRLHRIQEIALDQLPVDAAGLGLPQHRRR